MSLLAVSYRDVGVSAVDGGAISFGRSTSVKVKLDLNRADSALSRVAGVFQSQGGAWHLVNSGTRATFRLSIEGGIEAVLAPGSAPLALPVPSVGVVRVQTASTYVLEFSLIGDPVAMGLPESDRETTTISVAEQLELSSGERAVLVLLAENRLRDPSAGAWSVPSTSRLQERLGLSAKQIENIINALAAKFAPFVTGLLGTNQGRATTRRHQIVDFAIQSGCVTPADLARIDDP